MKSYQIEPLGAGTRSIVSVPGSKSYTNRAIFLSALTNNSVKISKPLFSDDTLAMISCLKTLGINIHQTKTSIEVVGSISGIKETSYTLNAKLSGTTLRFMLALSTIINGTQILTGDEGLLKRPVGDMVESLRSIGTEIEYLGAVGYPPLRISSNKVLNDHVAINGSQSSQYVSALLMIAPMIDNLTIQVTNELVSKPYVDMTIQIMKSFGVTVSRKGYKQFKLRRQNYELDTYTIEGDFSSAGYFFAIGALTHSDITVKNLNPDSIQADKKLIPVLQKMGNEFIFGKDEITIHGKGVSNIAVNMEDFPDQAMTVAVLAAFANGKTQISGIQSLRVKETERIMALENELKKLGIHTTSTHSRLNIQGGHYQGAKIATYNDHRMAMAFAVAGTKCPGVFIENPDVVRKTFPDFWAQLHKLSKNQKQRSNIVLIGMRGSGKSSIGKQLSQRLHRTFIDTDSLLSQQEKLSLNEIIEQKGWDYFRSLEKRIVDGLALTSDSVISTGGGIVLNQANIESLKKSGTLIWLNATVDTLYSHIKDSYSRSPLTNLADPREELRHVLSERIKLYNSAADIIIDTDSMEITDVVNEIAQTIEEVAL